ncbi:MAG: thiamine-phosphate kinase [Thermoanaerobaculia bacterium]
MRRRSEDSLLRNLRRTLARRGVDRLGDDAAILSGGPTSWAVTVDQQIEGVHFTAGTPPKVWARRLVAVCLSDVAAMGGRPTHAFLALQATPTLDVAAVLEAVADECARSDVELAGGDLASDSRCGGSLTVMARPVAGGRWLRRSAARPGDTLWLGGPVGWSRLGRELSGSAAIERLPAAQRRDGRRARRIHREPTPQLALGQALARRRRCAAIDVSDGLALDLARLCRESGVGAVVEREALPCPPEALARALGLDRLDCALHGGEDYVLLFTLAPGVRSSPEAGPVRIGTITDGGGLVLATGGHTRALPARGWDHLSSGTSGG